MNEPRPSCEWSLTSKCNYACEYCYQRGTVKEHCSDETTDAVLELFSELPGSWLIKLVGGEPLIHPRFFEICETIVKNGHSLCTTTNFSLPMSRLQHLIDICGDNLETVTASLHLSQVKNIDDFIEKAVAFNSQKKRTTRFFVTSVAVEESFETLQSVERRLTERGVEFRYQALKLGDRYVTYHDKRIEQYIADKLIRNTNSIRNKSLFGVMCHTGELFFVIHVNGEVTRCYNMQPGYYLGHVANGDFTRFQGAKPCMARRCTCTVPANRNMIRYGQKADNFTILVSYLQGIWGNLPFILSRLLKARD